MIHPIGTTKNGVQVYVDLVKSPAASSIARQPQLLNLVKELIGRQRMIGPVIEAEYDMGRPVGYDFIIETPDDSAVFYAQVLRDNVMTRFIKSGKPAATNHITITLQRTPQNDYELQNVRIGRLAPARPGAPNESADSKAFWVTHAVVQEGQVLQPRTITKDCPY